MDELKLRKYVDMGFSISRIAFMEGKSKTSVRHWMKKFELKTSFAQRGRTPIQNCSHCGSLLTSSNGYWTVSKQSWNSLCKKCSAANTQSRWKKSKDRALEYKGGKCEICGYAKCSDALEFHHIDPTTKEKNFGNMKLRKWEDQKNELDKCILLCSNCHREIHYESRNTKN